MRQSSCLYSTPVFYFYSRRGSPRMAEGDPVTLAQIRDLLQPVTARLDDLSGQVASIKKKKPDHLVDSADVKWRKEGTKMQYKAWSEAWDHCDKARDAASRGDQVATKEALKEGINFLETKMRDVLCANQYGWDWVQEFNAPPLAKAGEDEAKFRKTSKAVSQKRLERERIRKKPGNYSKFTGGNNFSMWQLKKVIAAMQNGDANISEVFSSYKPRQVGGGNRGSGDRYANMTCNHCGLRGHIWSGCPARTGSKTGTAGQ